jgi:hypothetical protein
MNFLSCLRKSFILIELNHSYFLWLDTPTPLTHGKSIASITCWSTCHHLNERIRVLKAPESPQAHLCLRTAGKYWRTIQCPFWSRECSSKKCRRQINTSKHWGQSGSEPHLERLEVPEWYQETGVEGPPWTSFGREWHHPLLWNRRQDFGNGVGWTDVCHSCNGECARDAWKDWPSPDFRPVSVLNRPQLGPLLESLWQNLAHPRRCAECR